MQFCFICCTRGCQNSLRRAVFQCTITYRTFAHRRAKTLQIIPRIREHLKRAKWQSGSECSSVYSTLKASIESRRLTKTSTILAAQVKIRPHDLRVSGVGTSKHISTRIFLVVECLFLLLDPFIPLLSLKESRSRRRSCSFNPSYSCAVAT